MPRKSKHEEEELDEELHPFVENHIDEFEQLVELTDKIKELQVALQDCKREKLALEREICDAISDELDSDSQLEPIEYKTLKVQYSTKTVLNIGKRGKKKKD